MTRTCWRTTAGILALSLGGIVVWAEDQPAKPAANPRAACPTCRIAPATADIPVLETQVSAPPIIPALPDAGPTGIIVARSETPLAPAAAIAEDVKFAPARIPELPTPPPVVQIPAPMPEPPPAIPMLSPMPEPPPMPPVATLPPITGPKEAPCIDPPPALRTEVPVITFVKAEPPAPPPPAAIATIPPPPPAPLTQTMMSITPTAPLVAPSLSTFPWKLNLEMIGGLTHLELRNGDAVQIRVQCERLDLQSPSGGLQASGRVVVSGPCLEASCERLLISWQSGQIALEGHVRLICQNNGQRTELGTDSICFRLNGLSQGIEFNSREVGQQIMMPRR